MKLASLLVAALMCALPVAASAQWQWVDKDGRKVFSDQPPPVDLPEKNIVKRPGNSGRTASSNTTVVSTLPQPGVSAPAPADAAKAPVGVDKELQEKAKQAKDAETAQKAAEAEKAAKAKAENCKRAREAKATLDSGTRLSRLNSKGEREVMDDASRAVEMKAAQNAISTSCAS